MKTIFAVAVASLALATVLASRGHFRHFEHLQDLEDADDEEAIQCMLSDVDEDCTEAMAELKGRLHNIVATNCGDCTEEERELVIEYFSGLFRRNPSSRRPLQSKYDPTGEYRRKFGHIWRKKGIQID